MADVGIAGAGLVGPLLAVYLARRGHDVELYERRSDPRRIGAEGRSINLALSARGIDALDRAGLAEEVLSHALPMRGRMMHSRTGELSYQSYSADGSKAINSISRHGLNVLLVEAAAAEARVKLHFDARLVSVAADSGEMTLDTPTGRRSVTHDVVIGADGAYSAARDAIVRRDRADFRQEHLPWGYKELTIGAAASGRFALDPGALHIWPRGDSMMIALPNPDRTFTATCFWPYDGADGLTALDGGDDTAITARFERDYPDAVPLLSDLTGEFRRNPVGALVTVHVWPWTAGRLALLGDAAHAIVPFFGQGMNCAFEDVVELDRCLAETGDDWSTALSRYAERRKPNADAIAELALGNFVEMRDKVASPVFRLGKRIEHALERLAPDHFDSLYELISFTTVPYAEARRRVAAQRRFPRNLLALGAAGAALVSGGRRRHSGDG
jgi:kynurenine 3-monooxygenase